MTWVATNPSTLAVLSPESAMALLGDPQISRRVAGEMADQLCEFISWQKIVSVHPVSARVCAWLLWQTTGSPSVTVMTHAELAWRLNTTRESITRVFQRLQADEILRRDGDSWLVSRPERLRELASGDTRTLRE